MAMPRGPVDSVGSSLQGKHSRVTSRTITDLDHAPLRTTVFLLLGNKPQGKLFLEEEKPTRLQGFDNYTMVVYHVMTGEAH